MRAQGLKINELSRLLSELDMSDPGMSKLVAELRIDLKAAKRRNTELTDARKVVAAVTHRIKMDMPYIVTERSRSDGENGISAAPA